MLIIVLFLALVLFFIIRGAIKKNQSEGTGNNLSLTSGSYEKVNKNIASVLDSKGYPIGDIVGAINSKNWDLARAALQKIAYQLVGDHVSQAEKDEFKALMTKFADRDPLYRQIMHQVRPVIQSQPGIMQSKIYIHAPQYDQETIRYVLYFAHELEDIKRIKKGNSYQLFVNN